MNHLYRKYKVIIIGGRFGYKFIRPDKNMGSRCKFSTQLGRAINSDIRIFFGINE